MCFAQTGRRSQHRLPEVFQELRVPVHPSFPARLHGVARARVHRRRQLHPERAGQHRAGGHGAGHGGGQGETDRGFRGLT